MKSNFHMLSFDPEETKNFQGKGKFDCYVSTMQSWTQLIHGTRCNQWGNTNLCELMANITCIAKIIKSLIMHIKHRRQDN